MRAIVTAAAWVLVSAAIAGATPTPSPPDPARPSPTRTYQAPPTPKPVGRPGELRCWRPDFDQVLPPPVHCCYEWQGDYTGHGSWVFRQCVRL